MTYEMCFNVVFMFCCNCARTGCFASEMLSLLNSNLRAQSSFGSYQAKRAWFAVFVITADNWLILWYFYISEYFHR